MSARSRSCVHSCAHPRNTHAMRMIAKSCSGVYYSSRTRCRAKHWLVPSEACDVSGVLHQIGWPHAEAPVVVYSVVFLVPTGWPSNEVLFGERSSARWASCRTRCSSWSRLAVANTWPWTWTRRARRARGGQPTRARSSASSLTVQVLCSGCVHVIVKPTQTDHLATPPSRNPPQPAYPPQPSPPRPSHSPNSLRLPVS